MTIYKSVEDSLYDFLAPLVAPSQVLFSHEAGNEPTSSYLLINVLDASPASKKKDVFAREVGNTDEFKTSDLTTYLIQVKIQAIGKKADDIVQRVEQSFTRDKERDILWHTYKTSVMNVSRIRRSPILRETKFIESYILDVTLSAALSDSYDIDIVEKVVVDTSIDGISSSVVIQYVE